MFSKYLIQSEREKSEGRGYIKGRNIESLLETDLCVYYRNHTAHYSYMHICIDDSIGTVEVWTELDKFQNTDTENQAQV